MTGFARREIAADWGELVWELKSVNHRYLEVSKGISKKSLCLMR